MKNGFRIAGKAFTVVEDLRQLAEQNKGKTVKEFLFEQRQKELHDIIDRQLREVFGGDKK
jgi:hypothetical protein